MALKINMKKLDKLTEDLKKIDQPRLYKGGYGGKSAVAMFQRKGILEKKGSDDKWHKRTFVLRDSFLFSYGSSKVEDVVHPNHCIHLAKSKLEIVQLEDRPFAFGLTTRDKDHFIFAADSEKELNLWRKDLEIARLVTHKSMVKLAIENHFLAESKGLLDTFSSYSSSALSLLTNPEYLQNTPMTGGAEGWLFTPDFCVSDPAKSSLKKSYFMLIDSHLLMFSSGDALKKPRGAMYLVGTSVTEMDDETEGNFRFVVKATNCPEFIELVARGETQRARWMNALRIGARITTGDFNMLLKEHELLSDYTPEAAEPVPSAPEHTEETDQYAENVKLEDYGIQGDELEPGASQPYDIYGNPILRTPEGKLVDSKGEEVNAKTRRFTARGEEMDAFNRPLPKGAVCMFTEDGQAIGVGPDGVHYLADGTVVPQEAPHYDRDGNVLSGDVVAKANSIAQKVEVAIRVRQKIKGDTNGTEQVDVLGRTFRPSKDQNNGEKAINADGVEVPLASARRVVNKEGKLVAHQEVKKEKLTGKLTIKADDEGEVKEIGSVEIDENTLMADVRVMIAPEVTADFPDFVFMINYIPITREEEVAKLAMCCLPEVFIRGIQLNPVVQTKIFSKKVDSLIAYEETKRKEAKEFEDIMAKVRNGNFLKKVAQ